jgi:hypothetical protein
MRDTDKFNVQVRLTSGLWAMLEKCQLNFAPVEHRDAAQDSQTELSSCGKIVTNRYQGEK